MEQLSDEELDHAAEEDSDKEDQDLDKMFGAWLGELDKLTQSLDDGKPEKVRKSPLRQETNLANFSYRFSMYNLNEALNQGDTVDLDALMADLCSIEQELSTIGSKPNSTAKAGLTVEGKVRQKPPPGRGSNKVGGGSGGGGSSSSSSSARASPSSTVRGHKPLTSNFSLDDITAQLEKASRSMDEAARQSSPASLPPPASHHRRTGSAGTVSDHDVRSISNSSRSSINSAASSMDSLDIDKVLRPSELGSMQPGQPATEHALLRRPSKQARRHLDFAQEEVEVDLSTHSYLDRETSLILKNIAGKPSHLLTKEEQAAKLKAEKIRVALEKIKEAQVKKLVIRVHMSDESSKTMMVDERQTVRQVLDSLLDKSHCGYSPDWSLVETISELQMVRGYNYINCRTICLTLTKDVLNKLMFIERIEKYALFKNPQNYLLGKKETSEMADRNKEALLEECFCGSSVTVPEIEGVLWLKEDGKKSWKKRYFLLRASGIYFVPKGKAKVSRDLVCFLQLDHVNVYYGQDYRNKYKAPTDYCLALKHPQIQKKSQYIKYLCCDDVRTLHQWVNGIRIAKYGKQLYVNYQEAMKRTEAAYDWSSLSSSSIKSGSSSSSLPESHSNHSNQSDSGVSDTLSSGHVRSQSIVSSIFSEAWKRGTQIEESSKVDLFPFTLQPQPTPLDLTLPAPSIMIMVLYFVNLFKQGKGEILIQEQVILSIKMSMSSTLFGLSRVMEREGRHLGVLYIQVAFTATNVCSSCLARYQIDIFIGLPNIQSHFLLHSPASVHSPKAVLMDRATAVSVWPSVFVLFIFSVNFIQEVSIAMQLVLPMFVWNSVLARNCHTLYINPVFHFFISPLSLFGSLLGEQHSTQEPLANERPNRQGNGRSPPCAKWPIIVMSASSRLLIPRRAPNAVAASATAPQHLHHIQEQKQQQQTFSGCPAAEGLVRVSQGSVTQPQTRSFLFFRRVENLLSKFGQPPESPSPSASGSPSKDPSAGPPAPPKPGKLNLSNLPIVFPQGKGGAGSGAKEVTTDFPSPPSDFDFFPPPPPDSELLPPPLGDPLGSGGAPKVAVVNPQPQAWNKASLKKTPPPTLPRRNDSTRLTQGEGPEPPTTPPPQQQPPPPFSPQPPTSPKGNLAVQPNFLADLNRTLQRKSITRHSSLSSSRMSKLEPTATMDDMVLPPPPPELLLDQQKQGSYMSGNISGYATLRRGPPPAPPKRDQSTKLTGEW
ncbi:RAPH1 protein, partial [Amia calva]|nr:RAPH1 protein [Amia calva]